MASDTKMHDPKQVQKHVAMVGLSMIAVGGLMSKFSKSGSETRHYGMPLIVFGIVALAVWVKMEQDQQKVKVDLPK